MMKYLCLLLSATLLVACGSSPSPVLPPKPITDIKNQFKIRKAWSGQYGNGNGAFYLRLTPVYQDNKLYVIDYSGKLYAVDAHSGDTLWQVQHNIKVNTALSYAAGQLLVGTSSGKLIAFDAQNGAIRWQQQLASEVSATPREDSGIVVVRTQDGHIYGLDAQTGKPRWTVTQIVPNLTLRGNSAPVISNNIVLIGNDNGRMVALTLDQGKILWPAQVALPSGRTDLERIIDVDAEPVVVNDIIYAVAYQGRIAAIQLGSGRVIWTRDIDSYIGMSVDSYRIYMVDTENNIWALDRTTGATLWKQDALQRRSLTRPVFQDKYIVVADYNGYIHWINRDDGKIVARTRLLEDVLPDDEEDVDEELFSYNNNILANTLIVKNRLFAVDRRGNLEAFDVSIAKP